MADDTATESLLARVQNMSLPPSVKGAIESIGRQWEKAEGKLKKASEAADRTMGATADAALSFGTGFALGAIEGTWGEVKVGGIPAEALIAGGGYAFTIFEGNMKHADKVLAVADSLTAISGYKLGKAKGPSLLSRFKKAAGTDKKAA